MAAKSQTALASLLDKVNQIGTLPGGEVTANFKKSDDSYLELDPNIVCNWKFHDRPSEELGDLDAFAEELKTVGQIHPCILRPIIHDNFKYEVVIGERRWRAAKIAGIKLKAIITQYNDRDAALLQALENSNRKDLSWYAKGLSYFNLVGEGVITQKDLQESLKLSQSSIRNLLSYGKINDKIKASIKDMSRISPATAYEISRLQEKGQEYINAIISIADRLQTGKIGHNKINDLINDFLSKNEVKKITKQVFSKKGKHLFTWRQDSNGNIMIAFTGETRNPIYNSMDEIEKIIVKELEERLP